MSSSINNFNILLGSSLIMESLVLKHVFFLTKDETSYVAYKNYRYEFHSHKDKGTDISMSKKEMKILLDHLPSFQAKLKAIIKEYNDDPDEDSDQDPDQDPEDQCKPVKKKRKVEATQKSMPSKNWKVEIINAFKKFETRLILMICRHVVRNLLKRIFENCRLATAGFSANDELQQIVPGLSLDSVHGPKDQCEVVSDADVAEEVEVGRLERNILFVVKIMKETVSVLSGPVFFVNRI